MLMNGDINLLILDEPTNHLDLPSREWIEEAVGQYGETLIFISHDRYFINRFATRVWEIEDGVFTDFFGNYSEYCAYKADCSVKAAVKKEPSARPKQVKKADAQKELRRLEREIEKLEGDLGELGRQKDEFSTDYEKLMELDERERGVQLALDVLMGDWERAASGDG
jgi:ATPase subunit of ABC transporter with duplicated ATPase domains